ncbi:MAG: hypothetical protein ACFFEK_13290 [Candidatus Thorarchaeota archaeon]
MTRETFGPNYLPFRQEKQIGVGACQSKVGSLKSKVRGFNGLHDESERIIDRTREARLLGVWGITIT